MKRYMEPFPKTSEGAGMVIGGEAVDLQNVLTDSQIPCISEQIIDSELKLSRPKMISVTASTVKRMKWRENALFGKPDLGGMVSFSKISPKTKISISKKVDRRKETVDIKAVNNDLIFQKEIANFPETLCENSDSDIEIDVGDNFQFPVDQHINDNKNLVIVGECSFSKPNIPIKAGNEFTSIGNTTFGDNSSIKEQLYSDKIPESEYILEENIMIDLEKFVFQETCPILVRSDEQYLILRNHIVSMWNNKRPHYLTKMEIQRDFCEQISKNTINKIHNFLEQIGAINYGSGNVKYVRPLHKIFRCPVTFNQIKRPTQSRRPKKKFLNNGEGGCTVSHGEHGEIIEKTIINEDPPPPKQKIIKKVPVQLIHCKSFVTDYKFKVTLDISTLLLMDFHAHSSLSEVMGLLGGYWNSDTKVLSIKHYEPCRNLASSSTHCDMCPISQASSAEKISNLNMDLLGWFHSHPTFAPEPSQQDLDTQQTLQTWIGFGKPCVGVILSPFYKPNLMISSDYRCMVVDKLIGDEIYSPYKFKVEVTSNDFNLNDFLLKFSEIHSIKDLNQKIQFSDPYLYNKNIKYFDKFISSIKMTVERYLRDNEHLQKEILRYIKNVFNFENT